MLASTGKRGPHSSYHVDLRRRADGTIGKTAFALGSKE